MGQHARYRLILSTKNAVIIKDIGPHSKHLTVTNDAEWVVVDLQHRYMERILFQTDGELKRLLYVSSDRDLHEILLFDNGGYCKFAGFRSFYI